MRLIDTQTLALEDQYSQYVKQVFSHKWGNERSEVSDLNDRTKSEKSKSYHTVGGTEPVPIEDLMNVPRHTHSQVAQRPPLFRDDSIRPASSRNTSRNAETIQASGSRSIAGTRQHHNLHFPQQTMQSAEEPDLAILARKEYANHAFGSVEEVQRGLRETPWIDGFEPRLPRELFMTRQSVSISSLSSDGKSTSPAFQLDTGSNVGYLTRSLYRRLLSPLDRHYAAVRSPQRERFRSRNLYRESKHEDALLDFSARRHPPPLSSRKRRRKINLVEQDRDFGIRDDNNRSASESNAFSALTNLDIDIESENPAGGSYRHIPKGSGLHTEVGDYVASSLDGVGNGYGGASQRDSTGSSFDQQKTDEITLNTGLYISYTISEDRTGDYEVQCGKRLAALSRRSNNAL